MSAAKTPDQLTGNELLRAFARQIKDQRRLVSHGLGVSQKFSTLATAMRELLDDSDFVELLRAEKLDEMPTELFTRCQMVKLAPKALNQ